MLGAIVVFGWPNAFGNPEHASFACLAVNYEETYGIMRGRHPDLCQPLVSSKTKTQKQKCAAEVWAQPTRIRRWKLCLP